MRWRKPNRDQDLDREIRSHLELEMEDQRAAGAAEVEAHFAAKRQFGNATLIHEVVHEMRGWTSIERIWQDARYAVRSLRKSPGFTIAAVLSLALGIGANTAIFSLLNAVVLRLLPVPAPDELVHFTYTQAGPPPNNWNSWFGYPQYERFRDQSRTLAGVFGGTTIGRVNVGFRGVPGLAQADAYTDNFFTVLKLKPQAGRFFAPGEDRTDSTVAILSDRYWRSRFGGDPQIVGESITNRLRQ